MSIKYESISIIVVSMPGLNLFPFHKATTYMTAAMKYNEEHYGLLTNNIAIPFST